MLGVLNDVACFEEGRIVGLWHERLLKEERIEVGMGTAFSSETVL